MITEDQLEQLCLDWFRETGYEVIHGPDISPGGTAPERADYGQVILAGRLRLASRHPPWTMPSTRSPGPNTRACSRTTGLFTAC